MPCGVPEPAPAYPGAPRNSLGAEQKAKHRTDDPGSGDSRDTTDTTTDQTTSQE